MEDISFKKALEITIGAIQPLSAEDAAIERLVGRVAGEDVYSLVDVPSLDISLYPLKTTSRLQMMAKAEGIICIPEGKECLKEDERVNVQLLTGWYG